MISKIIICRIWQNENKFIYSFSLIKQNSGIIKKYYSKKKLISKIMFNVEVPCDEINNKELVINYNNTIKQKLIENNFRGVNMLINLAINCSFKSKLILPNLSGNVFKESLKKEINNEYGFLLNDYFYFEHHRINSLKEKEVSLSFFNIKDYDNVLSILNNSNINSCYTIKKITYEPNIFMQAFIDNGIKNDDNLGIFVEENFSYFIIFNGFEVVDYLIVPFNYELYFDEEKFAYLQNKLRLFLFNNIAIEKLSAVLINSFNRDAEKISAIFEPFFNNSSVLKYNLSLNYQENLYSYYSCYEARNLFDKIDKLPLKVKIKNENKKR